jgi:hypothetical protein
MRPVTDDDGGSARMPDDLGLRVVITSVGTVALADRGWRENGPVTAHGTTSVFAGFRFPREVITVAVRWYLRYGLSYRDVEELLAERGVTVDHVTIYRWVRRFTPEFIEAARPCRHCGCRLFIRPGQAACRYSWRVPPSRSCRRISMRVIWPGSVVGPGNGRRGAACPRAR